MLCRYNLDSFQSGLVVSSSLFGALAGSSAAFVVGDKLGRRRELLLAAVLYGKLPFESQARVLFEHNEQKSGLLAEAILQQFK